MAASCLYDGDFIDLTEEIDTNSPKKEVVKISPSVSTGKNINTTPVVSAQQLNFNANGGKTRDISSPLAGNNALLVVDQSKSKQVTAPLGASTGDIILTPSPSEIRQKKFPIDINKEKNSSNEDVIIVPNQTENSPQSVKSQMAVLTPIVANQKQPIPVAAKGKVTNVVRKKIVLKNTVGETQKTDIQTSSLKRKIEEEKRNESTRSPNIVIQSVFTVSEGSSESQSAPIESDVIYLSDDETSSGKQKTQISAPKVLGVHSSGTNNAVKQTQGLTKQIPLDAQKIFNGQNIVPIALDKSQISHSIEDIVETVSAVGAITPSKEGENKPVYLLLYPLESGGGSSDGQVNKVLALVPKNSELSSKNLSSLKLQNLPMTVPNSSAIKKILPVTKDVNQSKSTTPVLKSTTPVLKSATPVSKSATPVSKSATAVLKSTLHTNQQKELPVPSLIELNNRHSYPPTNKIVGVAKTPPQNNSTDNVYQAVGTAIADPLVFNSPKQTKTKAPPKKISPPRELVQIAEGTFVFKNTSKLPATKTVPKDPIHTGDNFVVPSIPAPKKKTVVYTSQIVKPVPRAVLNSFSPEGVTKRVKAVDPLSRGADEEVQIEAPCVVTPVDITQILKQGMKPEIKGRCQYQRFKPEDNSFKGFTTRQMWKASCAKELAAILKEETKKVAVWKKSMKQRYESNFVACGGSTSYFLPENVVKTEVVDVYDLTDDSLPTIGEVISQVNREVLQLKESQRKRQIKTEVVKRNEALQLIKQGLEMMKRWSRESSEPDLVYEVQTKSENVTEIVTGKRQRKPNKVQDVQFDPPSRGRSRRAQTTPVKGKDAEVKKAPPRSQGRRAGTSRRNKRDISDVVETKAVETEKVVKRRKTVKKTNVDLNTGNDSDDLLMVKRVDIIKHNKVTTKVRRRK